MKMIELKIADEDRVFLWPDKCTVKGLSDGDTVVVTDDHELYYVQVDVETVVQMMEDARNDVEREEAEEEDPVYNCLVCSYCGTQIKAGQGSVNGLCNTCYMTGREPS